jgi:integrase
MGLRVWQADWRGADGRRHRRVLGANRRDAERALAKLIAERDSELNGVARVSGLDLPIAEIVDHYLEHLRATARKQTAHDAEVALRRIVRDAPLRFVRDVSKARIMAWRGRRVHGGISHKTANTEVATLQAALNHAIKYDRIASNPLLGLETLPTTEPYRKRIARALTDAEAVKIVYAASVYDSTHSGLPRTPMLRTLIETGARWNEVRSATWGDLDFDVGQIRYRAVTTKTKHERIVPIMPSLLDLLADLRQQQTIRMGVEPRQEDAIFLTPEGKNWPRNGARFREWLAKILVRAGVRKVDVYGKVLHIHAMRHTFTTRMILGGVPIPIVAAMTGHRCYQTLWGTYVHLATADARKAMKALPPLPYDGNVPPV